MVNNKTRHGRLRVILRLSRRILLGAVLLLMTVYAGIGLAFGLQLRENLTAARSTCTAISVEVEQVSRADNSRFWYAVVLVPADEASAAAVTTARPSVPDDTPDDAQRQPTHTPVTTMYATTIHPDIHAGQVLTAYYNEATRRVELVDFELADTFLLLGGAGLGLAALHLLILAVRLVLAARRRRQHNAPVNVDSFS